MWSCPGMPDPLGSRRQQRWGWGEARSTGFLQTHKQQWGIGVEAVLGGPWLLLDAHTPRSPLWTELEQVRLIKSKSWEDVWVSDGLWKAFRPPRQTTG